MLRINMLKFASKVPILCISLSNIATADNILVKEHRNFTNIIPQMLQVKDVTSWINKHTANITL